MKLKPYPKYKDSGVQWIGKIPAEWKVRKLKYSYEIIGKTDIPASEGNENGKYPFFTSGEVIKFVDKSVTNGEYVIVGDGGISNFKYYEGEFSYSDHCFLLKTNKQISTRFLYYFLIGNGETLDILCFHGIGLRNLDKYKFNSFLACFPPFSDQTFIANFLDSKTARIDTLIEKDKKLIGLLKEKRAALINHAVTKGLDPNVKMKDSGIDWIGEMPEGWEVRKVSKSFDIIGSGTTPKSQEEIYYDKGDISWVITGDLNDGLLKETSKKITKEAIKDYSMLKMYPKNSLIIAMYGATIGKIALLNIEACTNQACCVLAKSKIFETKYVFYLFIANKNNIISYSYGGGQPNISQDVIKTLKIPIPPKSEQKAIVEHLDKATARIDKTIKLIQKKIELLEEYKKSLIHHTVTGKIDVRGLEY